MTPCFNGGLVGSIPDPVGPSEVSSRCRSYSSSFRIFFAFKSFPKVNPTEVISPSPFRLLFLIVMIRMILLQFPESF
jgi:hypothetical protein